MHFLNVGPHGLVVSRARLGDLLSLLLLQFEGAFEQTLLEDLLARCSLGCLSVRFGWLLEAGYATADAGLYDPLLSRPISQFPVAPPQRSRACGSCFWIRSHHGQGPVDALQPF